MTYIELLREIAIMTPEQQSQDVTVFVSGVNEYYGLANYPLCFTDPAVEDVLDPNHPYLVI
jgi:hypothetical protein